ncbi:CBS domain-containing protein [Zeaxanthinibacter sp. PT1]|uniref:CBS domain-containing protein n=1 Tax=Zeaxanthinibacter TaxID=561554 RepID=UPI00234B5769|nr:CBS domain-containing protein [Zeaxanthinibacter sp. PT1]MDC6350038.1 CBS domain-containing protein [Zeaxanthinibacter sp. PT1]
MKIQEHISDNLDVFDISAPLQDVLRFFRGSGFSHVAVVEDRKFLGVMSEEDFRTIEEKGQLADHRNSLETFHVPQDASWLDILKCFADNQANLLPVLDEQAAVIGYYDLSEVLDFLVETPFFNEPGGLLVVATGAKDHSFSQIAQIVESNNAKLIGAFISDYQNDIVQTTIKISSGSMNEVLQSFRRYNYNILFGNMDDQFLEDLKKRSDYLDKYLNV